jgi:hypothetical protein
MCYGTNASCSYPTNANYVYRAGAAAEYRHCRRTTAMMTPVAYKAALARLGLTPASRATAERLGVGIRSSQRYASGERPVPKPVQNLLNEMLKRGA